MSPRPTYAIKLRRRCVRESKLAAEEMWAGSFNFRRQMTRFCLARQLGYADHKFNLRRSDMRKARMHRYAPVVPPQIR